jgi:hypothetical protein
MESLPNKNQLPRGKLLPALAGSLALGSWLVVLTYHNIADGDLWARLSIGASLWERGVFPRTDPFGFTPRLPLWVDHEWGAGFLYYGVLRMLGPEGLMLAKILLAVTALGVAIALARRFGTTWPVVLLLVAPCAWCILPGYVPVLRSHALTYALFGLTLFCLEKLRTGARWPAVTLVTGFCFWVNVHGGFVAGLGIVGIYTGVAWWRREHASLATLTFAGCALASLVNPYGPSYWQYLLPALLHPRPDITEWRPMPLFAVDSFLGFRVLFLIALAAILGAWDRERVRRWLPGLLVLAVTAFVAFRSRRHAPFFGVACLAFLGPWLQAGLERVQQTLPARWTRALSNGRAAFGLHALIAAFTLIALLPKASVRVLAPVGAYPVREVDVLMRARASGNVVVPFDWGSYTAWRLYPRVKVSMDGRYETAYTEESFQMSLAFHGRRGKDWDRLIREHPVDFVILDLQKDALRPEDLRPHGYEVIWQTGDLSALLARGPNIDSLRRAAAELPPTTIQPLDPAIPRSW